MSDILNKNNSNIKNPTLCIKVGNNIIPKDLLESFDLIISENEILPKCVIRLKDIKNEIFSSFDNLSLGSKISASVIENDKKTSYIKSSDIKSLKYDFPTLTISHVLSSMDSLNDNLGLLEILCEHPWKMFQDFSSKAYVGIPNSEIIKKLLFNNNNKYFNFNVINKDYFKESDEDGSIPRYKCDEGDLDFIKTKLLPYTLINGNPAYFWVGENNDCHLNSFQDMFLKESKAAIYGGTFEDIKEETINIGKSGNGLIFSKDLLIKVGSQHSDKFIKIIKSKVSYDNLDSLKTISGTLLPKISIDKLSNKLPVSLESLLFNPATSSEDYINRNLSDLIALSLNSQKNFNEFMKIEITTNFCGLQVNVGDNVNLLIPKVGNKNHWASGKWHINSIKYSLNTFDNLIISKITLIRPCFINDKNSSIINPSSLYKSGDNI